MDDVAQLLAVEDIKRLKARYFRALDTKDWDLLRTVFAPDIVCDFRGSTRDPKTGIDTGAEATANVLHGRDEAIKLISAGMNPTESVHHGHMPEIEIDGPDTAHGVWAMFDSVRIADGPVREFNGYGHYHETYRKTDGQWQIATIRLTRLRVDFLFA